MRIIEIKALSNGAHRNQTFSGETIPDGYAIVPYTLDTPNFPFGEVTVVDSVVTEWKPLPIPEPEPVEPPKPTQTEVNASNIDYLAMMTGVDLPQQEVV